jgi:PASTA domain-containing protein
VANTLHPGQTLNRGGRLESNNGRFELHFQHDGNLVLYQGSNSGLDPVRDTGTQLLPPDDRPVRAIMQQDGNFVLYDSDGVSRWHTGTWDNPGSKLVLQDDREVVILNPNNRRLWAWGTRDREVVVPDVREWTIRRAVPEIRDAGLVEDLYGDCSGGNLTTGAWVKSQSPDGGSRVLVGSTVELECSSEPMP